MKETSYGELKRLAFVEDVIARRRPRRVLDVGCGTGAQLTLPLAQRHPEIMVLGIDTDIASLDEARRQASGTLNLEYALQRPEGSWDLVIASEVVEHVDDPEGFLGLLRKIVAADGALVITLPNGYGVFEWMSLCECLGTISAIRPFLAQVKRRLLGQGPSAPPNYSLAISPHVNFFSLAEIRRLFAAAGFTEVSLRPRTFLCGWLLDDLIRGERLVKANADIADRLPAVMASDWMFELEPSAVPRSLGWRRGAWSRWRRRLNFRRWGLDRS